ncbi:MAG: hypothetical protein JRJ44_05635 [Deltaproteobacteria bacterium]|nr:hypothetical protein [Deltaproteobacteria bacterium]
MDITKYEVMEMDATEMSEFDGGIVFVTALGLGMGAFGVGYVIGYWWNHRR